MLRRYYLELCSKPILAELGGEPLRRTQRLMLKVLRPYTDPAVLRNTTSRLPA